MRAPEQLRSAFTDPEWLYELKFDGYRCLAGIERDDGFQPETEAERDNHAAARVKLHTKSGANCSSWFPELWGPLAGLPGGPHVIDGEVCVLRADGTSDFRLLQERARRRRWYPGAPQVTFCAFDILVHNNRRVTGLPLVERKEVLRQLLADQPKQYVLYVDSLPADEGVFQAMVGAGLQIEGVMAKRKGSVYQPGVRSKDWLKIKRPGWNEGRDWKS